MEEAKLENDETDGEDQCAVPVGPAPADKKPAPAKSPKVSLLLFLLSLFLALSMFCFLPFCPSHLLRPYFSRSSHLVSDSSCVLPSSYSLSPGHVSLPPLSLILYSILSTLYRLVCHCTPLSPLWIQSLQHTAIVFLSPPHRFRPFLTPL